MRIPWEITFQFFGGKPMYRVFRVINVFEVDHSGNREYATGYVTLEEAKAKMEELNKNL